MILITTLIALGQQPPALSEAPSTQAPENGARVLASQRRLVRSFDFETAGAQGRVPGAWSRLVDRPGYPKFGSVGVDGDAAFEGEYALRFDVDGGSMAVGIRAGEIPIFPQSRYLVMARVRTEGLISSGARLAVTLHDVEGRPIAGTERLSEVLRTDGEWSTLSVESPLDIASARDLVFELRVEQPSAGADDLPTHVDVRGSAWFDQVEIWQLPRIDFASLPASGITRQPETPRLTASLRDLVEGRTVATIRVRDVDDAVVLERSTVVDGGHSTFDLELTGLAPGWYRGEFEVRDRERLVARSEQPVAILPQREPPAFARRPPAFGVGLWPVERGLDPIWLDLTTTLAPDYLVVPVWEGDRDAQLDHLAQDRVDLLLDGLFDTRIEPVFELAEVPRDLARKEHLDPDQLVDLLVEAPDRWRPALDPWMLQYGDEVSRWRLRTAPDDESSDRERVARTVLAFATDFVAAPRIEVVGPVNDPFVLPTGEGLSPVVSLSGVTAGGSEAVSGASPTGATVRFPIDATSSDPRTRGEDLARRLVEAWADGTSRLEVSPPWSRLERIPGATDTPLIGLDSTGFVLESVAGRLSGRPAEAEIPLGRGLRACLVGGSGPPLLVAWAEASGSPGVPVGLALGDGPLRVSDFLGATQLHVDGDAGSIVVPAAPVVIEGIDPRLARFRAGARLVPERIDAVTGRHDVELELLNAWEETIDIRVRALGPASWTFEPRSRRLAIEPGATAQIPFAFSYPRSQIDGPVDFSFEVEFLDGTDRVVQLLIPSAIESARVELATSWRRLQDETGRSTGFIVTVRGINTGDSPLNLEAFANARGFPPMRKWMPEIPLGSEASRSFLFRDTSEQPGGREVLVGVTEFDGTVRITRRIVIPAELGDLVGVDPNAAD